MATYTLLVTEETEESANLIRVMVMVYVQRLLGCLLTNPTFPITDFQHLLERRFADSVLRSEILVSLAS